MNARWTVHENDDALTLQIELGADCAITLNCPKPGGESDGEAPSVLLWTGNGECEFAQETVESFRSWLGVPLSVA